MLTILIALQVAQVQVAQPPVAKVASPDAVTTLQPMSKASPMRMHSKQRTLSQGRALLARAETVHVNAANDAGKAELEAKMDQLKSDLQFPVRDGRDGIAAHADGDGPAWPR